MKSVVADCGHRERPGMIDDGECRNCRGVSRARRSRTGLEPHRAAAVRQRSIQNDRGRSARDA